MPKICPGHISRANHFDKTRCNQARSHGHTFSHPIHHDTRKPLKDLQIRQQFWGTLNKPAPKITVIGIVLDSRGSAHLFIPKEIQDARIAIEKNWQEIQEFKKILAIIAGDPFCE